MIAISSLRSLFPAPFQVRINTHDADDAELKWLRKEKKALNTSSCRRRRESFPYELITLVFGSNFFLHVEHLDRTKSQLNGQHANLSLSSLFWISNLISFWNYLSRVLTATSWIRIKTFLYLFFACLLACAISWRHVTEDQWSAKNASWAAVLIFNWLLPNSRNIVANPLVCKWEALRRINWNTQESTDACRRDSGRGQTLFSSLFSLLFELEWLILVHRILHGSMMLFFVSLPISPNFIFVAALSICAELRGTFIDLIALPLKREKNNSWAAAA